MVSHRFKSTPTNGLRFTAPVLPSTNGGVHALTSVYVPLSKPWPPPQRARQVQRKRATLGLQTGCLHNNSRLLICSKQQFHFLVRVFIPSSGMTFLRVNTTSKMLQDPKLDLSSAVAVVKSLKTFVESKRDCFKEYEKEGIEKSVERRQCRRNVWLIHSINHIIRRWNRCRANQRNFE